MAYAGPLLSHAVSSSLDHCTRTGRPSSVARNAASNPASSAAVRAISLRAVHPHDAHAIPGYVEELRDAVPEAIRLHVVRVDRHLIVRGIGGRVRRTERRVTLERHLVVGFDDFGCGGESAVAIARDLRVVRESR